MDPQAAAVIRVDAVWLAVEPMDMRAGMETALARVVKVFGVARPHHAYLFANRRANRLKVLVHDGIGVWLAARRLHQGKFIWPAMEDQTVNLSRAQFDALVRACPGSGLVGTANGRTVAARRWCKRPWRRTSDKSIPGTGLLAHVLMAKYADHLPLYRQEGVFERADMAIARSTLAQWVGMRGVQLEPLVDALREELLTQAVLDADETPVAMLRLGNGKTHRAYL